MGTGDIGSAMTHDQLVGTLRSALGLPPGETPFPWQTRLLMNFVAGEIPRALDIPTGLGKTAVIAIWLVARAAGAAVPRRLVYVVDRRAVVDQATTVAERLRDCVEVNEALKRALGLERPLPISTLRGQFVDNKAWLEDPSAPAIVLGTIDMIGSRLLFGGYGVSKRMRPYHAGFLGADALIVLDEAHLVEPFERLIEQIAQGTDANGRSLLADETSRNLVPRVRSLSLSATGRERIEDEVFRLSDDDRTHAVVKKRLSAAKRLALRDHVGEKDLPEALAREAWVLSDNGTKPVRVIVFCTSRDHAQKVRDDLAKRSSASDSIELFVGGRRVFERQIAARWLSEQGFLAGSHGKPARAVFVIATSAGEVGVDLDADHAVCDLVAWERMVQRFGRVNRRGDGAAEVIVVPTSLEPKAEQALAKYARWRAWTEQRQSGVQGGESEHALEAKNDQSSDEELSEKEPKIKVEERRIAQQALRRDAVRALISSLREVEEGYDVSPGGLLDLRARASENSRLAALMSRATTLAPLHPPLTRALLEAWSMTSLDGHTGRPEVGPWIRGWEEDDAPQTTLVWRTHLPIDGDARLLRKQDLVVFREAADPHLVERLDTETWRVLAWLAKRVRAAKVRDVRDGQGEHDEPTVERSFRPNEAIGVLLDALEGDRVVLADDVLRGERRNALERTLQGATLVVDRRLCGLRNGLLAEDADEDVLDVTEWGSTENELRPELQRVVPFRIRHIGKEGYEPSSGWRTEARFPVSETDEGVTQWLVVESQVGQVAESEEGRSAAKYDQLLEEHEEWAETEVKRIGGGLGLPRDYVEMLAIAARLHDEGKQAARWQRAFRAPSGGRAPFYAKTTHAPDFQLLEGYRHELGSLPHAEMHPRVQELRPELRELCLHVIAAHHGHARPLIRTLGAEEPPTRLVERAREIAHRYAALEKRWGPWGLAWWEALLRAADQRASRRNDVEGGSRG